MADSTPFKNGQFLGALNGLMVQNSYTDSIGTSATTVASSISTAVSAVAFDNVGSDPVYIKFNGTASVADDGFDLCVPAGLSKSVFTFTKPDGTALTSISAISSGSGVTFNTVLHG